MQRSSASPTSYEVSRNERRPHCRSDTAGLCRRVDQHKWPRPSTSLHCRRSRRIWASKDSVVKWSVTLFVISVPHFRWSCGGRLADRLGRRTALLSSLVLFVIACIALALVQSAAVLLIGRIVSRHRSRRCGHHRANDGEGQVHRFGGWLAACRCCRWHLWWHWAVAN